MSQISQMGTGPAHLSPHSSARLFFFNLCESVKSVDLSFYLRHLRHLRFHVFPWSGL